MHADNNFTKIKFVTQRFALKKHADNNFAKLK